ncbi:D-arabinono-1,4-lactone oxidase [Brachybacterium aquaticum]|uniref:FAD-linked oxidoreductase n=1 Tax=Brachybacterium aquaticum TaxID=1432564 RepID=A0A841AF17_9MICO|nr:D-arabinono-1,4-lactone oxidase [Brachybacterium aquaticum]MBB5831724.1 FAD-linked oxidoreductase [Brachybacterium aquaticum]
MSALVARPGRHTHRNWSGSARFTPQQVLTPRGEDEVLSALALARRRGLPLRVVGGGHSFTPLVATDGVLLSLDEHQGLVSADPATGLVTLRGGTRLWVIAELLAPHGLALSVMGDIDRQSIAGAIQTGTHGTGARLTGFAGMVRALRLALPDGSIVDVSPEREPHLFEAARLGLGTLGVILEVTLQCVPAYRLALHEATVPAGEAIGSFLADSALADHHEIFWFPRTDRATVRTMRRLPATAERHRPARALELLQREVLGNGAFEVMCRGAAMVPPLSRPVAEIASRAFAGPGIVDDSPAVYAAPRRVRFHESEWALPAERAEEALAALPARFEAEDVRVTFPLEIRRVAADDVWLSTAHGRDSVYLAAHRYHREDAGPYLRLVQDTLAPFDARPHWGKLHWLGAAELSRLYPRFADFTAVRRAVDPDGLLMTPYLDRLLGR